VRDQNTASWAIQYICIFQSDVWVKYSFCIHLCISESSTLKNKHIIRTSEQVNKMKYGKGLLHS